MTWSLFLSHLIGDYLMQTDEQAEGKKRSSWMCLYHVIMYIFPFMCFSDLVWWQFLAIAAQHFAQDRWGFVVWFMKWKGSARFATGPCSPWSIIVTDNILHLVWIAAVAWAGKALPW